jgi:nucleotide-binding universal stress UspA family protein
LPALDEITYAPEAVALACRLATPPTGGAPDASVLLTYIIEVPRSLAADAPMPDEEALANRALAEASESVRRCGLRPVPQVRKGRGAVDETLRAIREGNADLLVLVAPPGAASADAFGRLTAELSRRAPCEVILARAQPA